MRKRTDLLHHQALKELRQLCVKYNMTIDCNVKDMNKPLDLSNWQTEVTFWKGSPTDKNPEPVAQFFPVDDYIHDTSVFKERKGKLI